MYIRTVVDSSLVTQIRVKYNKNELYDRYVHTSYLVFGIDTVRSGIVSVLVRVSFLFDPFTRLGDNPPGMTDYQDCLLSSFTLLRIAVYTNTIYV